MIESTKISLEKDALSNQKALILSELDKKINWLHRQSLKHKGFEKKSYEDSVNSFVIFKMQMDALL